MLRKLGIIYKMFLGEKKLQIAASLNDLERVKGLIQLNCNVNTADELGRTPLHLAASRGYSQIVQVLIASKYSGPHENLSTRVKIQLPPPIQSICRVVGRPRLLS